VARAQMPLCRVPNLENWPNECQVLGPHGQHGIARGTRREGDPPGCSGQLLHPGASPPAPCSCVSTCCMLKPTPQAAGNAAEAAAWHVPLCGIPQLCPRHEATPLGQPVPSPAQAHAFPSTGARGMPVAAPNVLPVHCCTFPELVVSITGLPGLSVGDESRHAADVDPET
jgi:hypothetical protein